MFVLCGALRYFSYRLPQHKPELMVAYAARDIASEFEKYGFYRLGHANKTERLNAIEFVMNELRRSYSYAKQQEAKIAVSSIKFVFAFLKKIVQLENTTTNPKNIDKNEILRLVIADNT